MHHESGTEGLDPYMGTALAVARARLWVICDTSREDGFLIEALRPVLGSESWPARDLAEPSPKE